MLIASVTSRFLIVKVSILSAMRDGMTIEGGSFLFEQVRPQWVYNSIQYIATWWDAGITRPPNIDRIHVVCCRLHCLWVVYRTEGEYCWTACPAHRRSAYISSNSRPGTKTAKHSWLLLSGDNGQHTDDVTQLHLIRANILFHGSSMFSFLLRSLLPLPSPRFEQY
jgi:hypothetical protein